MHALAGAGADDDEATGGRATSGARGSDDEVAGCATSVAGGSDDEAMEGGATSGAGGGGWDVASEGCSPSVWPFRLLVSLVLALSTGQGPRGGVPVLECVTHHAIFEGLDPRMTVCIRHVSIEPSYEFFPKSSVGRVALLRLLCNSGVELVEFCGCIEQAYCSWPDGTGDRGCDASTNVSEDVLPVGVLELVQTAIELYV